MGNALHGVDLKIQRAREHLDSVDAEIRTTIENHVSRVGEKFDSASGQRTRIFWNRPDADPLWSIRIGEFAYQLQSALDHLVWQLAELNRPAPPPTDWPPRRTAFPYIRTGSLNDRNIFRSALRGLSRDHRRRIRKLQPYQSRQDAKAQPLWLLYKLRNVDAHQVLHTTFVDVELPDAPFHEHVYDAEKGEIEVVFPEGSPMKAKVKPVSLGPGDSLQTTLQTEGKFPLRVTFDQPGTPLHEQEVLPLLRVVFNAVSAIVDDFRADLS